MKNLSKTRFTNADNEVVYVLNEKDFGEMISLAGHEKVEICWPDGNWEWLEDVVKVWASEWSGDYNEQHSICLEWFQEIFEA